eukprot:4927803-Amphidinium_carterae.1
MSAVTTIGIGINSFEGTLPQSGLLVMRTMSRLVAPSNLFAGTLPNRAIAGLGTLHVSGNDFEVNLNRCNTLITGCTAGRPQQQLAGRANSTALAWRQQAGHQNCGSLCLRVSHMSRSCEHHGNVLEIILSRGLISEDGTPVGMLSWH